MSIPQRFFHSVSPFPAFAVIVLFFCPTTTALAQFSPGFFAGGGNDASPLATISAVGSCSVKQLPEAMQAVITVQGRAKTFDEAFEKLLSEQAATVEKLQKLGVEKERVQFEGLGVDQSQENKRRQMEAMISQRMRQAGQKPVSVPEVVTLTCKAMVEWPLAGKTPEDLLKESHAIRQKIKEADFTPKATELSLEEEELAEELGGMSFHSGDDEDSDEPRFLYIARIPEDEVRKAYVTAFQHARKQGENLAEATGCKLGVLLKASGTMSKNTASQNPYGRHNQDYYLMQMLNSQQYGSDDTRQRECLALTAEPVTFLFGIQAVFVMEP